MAQTNRQKAETIAQYLESVHMGTPNSTPEQDEITKIVGKFAYEKYPIPPAQWAKIITTPKDIDGILKKLAKNKAPGADGIPNIALKNLPKKTKTQLMYVTNAIMLLQHFPKQWKEAIVVPILKPGKDNNKVESYRPISLLSSVSKVVERAIYDKINNAFDIESKFPREQYGFKTKHNTVLLLAKVLSQAIDKFNQKQSTVFLTLDIKQAFDSVWHNGLTYKNLILHNLPLHVVTLLHSYMVTRKFKVKVEGEFSNAKSIRAGVPQGSILSPKLYNLYSADFPTYPNSNLALYADDALLYASSFSANVACKKVKNHLNKVLPWLALWKQEISENKCECMVITRKVTNTKIIEPVVINNKQILPNKTIKYLGLTLDSRLNFVKHITRTLYKVFGATQSLYSLLSERASLSPQNKLTIYKYYLRPVLTYAAPIWCGISDTQLNRLQIYQNKILRKTINADRWTKIQDLHNMTQTERITEYITKLAQKFYLHHTKQIDDTRQITKTRHVHNAIHKPLYYRLPIYFVDPPDEEEQ